MKILHLTLKKKWFDMIKSGLKPEEYREIKPYWTNRLISSDGITYNNFDIVRFKNGYGDVPFFDIKCAGIYIGKGQPQWGAPDKDVFIIKLGEIIKD